MKRDMDLIRQILLIAEARGEQHHLSGELKVPGHSTEVVAKHIELMEEAGLIEANILRIEARGALRGDVERITWEGYDFLEQARNEHLWSRAKGLLRKAGAGLTVETLRFALTELAKAALRGESTPA
jgi:hypothetical protein